MRCTSDGRLDDKNFNRFDEEENNMSMNQYRNNSQRQGGGGYGGGGYQQSSPQLIPDERIEFYLDKEKTKLDPNVFSDRAEKAADKIRQELNSAQLRRFFGEMKGYYQRWKNQSKSETAFEVTFLPLIKLMKSKVFYASNSKKIKIPNMFASFLLGGIDQIKDSKDFEAFILYFEAVVGFLYGKGMVSK